MKRLTLIAVILSFFCSCDPDMVYDEFQKTPGGEWKWEDKKVFEVPVLDSSKTYNIILNIRHTKDYPKSNLFVFVTTMAPTGQTIKDTVEIKIADEKGKWLGSGFGGIKLVSRMYRKNVSFKRSGTYSFTIEQAMRLPEIPVTDVGLRVEKFSLIK
jgi:gliding motility-associated lipoprotein GldH